MQLDRETIRMYYSDPEWQRVRRALKYTELNLRMRYLRGWLRRCKYSYESRVQVQNYLNALRRAGMTVPDVEGLCDGTISDPS